MMPSDWFALSILVVGLSGMAWLYWRAGRDR
jgi:hypothetical protein